MNISCGKSGGIWRTDHFPPSSPVYYPASLRNSSISPPNPPVLDYSSVQRIDDNTSAHLLALLQHNSLFPRFSMPIRAWKTRLPPLPLALVSDVTEWFSREAISCRPRTNFFFFRCSRNSLRNHRPDRGEERRISLEDSKIIREMKPSDENKRRISKDYYYFFSSSKANNSWIRWHGCITSYYKRDTCRYGFFNDFQRFSI